MNTDTEFVWRKWDRTPHWQYVTTFLGSDENGDWFGQFAGAEESRPGVVSVMPANRVVLVPKFAGWVATFYEGPHLDGIVIYVDIASQVEWDRVAGVVKAIDMDLDVIKTDERGTWIDDEDEFAERIVSMAYPQPEIEAAERNAAEVLAAVRDETRPFDGVHEVWLRALASMA